MIQRTVTKVVKRYGNSGGVYLPSSWIGGTVEIALASSPPRPEKDLPLALAGSMEHIVSILLYGSYARGEHTKGSDIDVIVVTDNHTKAMKAPGGLGGMNYDIRVMRADDIKRLASRDILLSKSLEDAKAILNDSFLDELRSIKPKGSLAERISLARSSIEIIKSLHDEGGGSASLVYPLVMRIKEMLLMKCAREGKRYTLGLLEGKLLEKGISKADYRKLMSIYRGARDGKKPGKLNIGDRTFMLVLELLEEMIADAEKKEKAKERSRVHKGAD